MLDHLRLAIPVSPLHTCEYKDGTFCFLGNLLNLGLHCGARAVRYNHEGDICAYDLYIPYDRLGTDFSDMAIKFHDEARNRLPYVELKASPAKLLQGHNVYGSDDIANGAHEMLGLLIEAFPKLCYYLNFDQTEVLHLDCTYSAQLPSQALIQPVIDYLANVSNKHATNSAVSYKNYVRWGKQNSRHLGRKAYGKYEEVLSQIDELKGQTGIQAVNKAQALIDNLPFADAKLRFEARICKTYLVNNNYPTNLSDLVDLQRQNPTLLQELWQKAFKPIFDALEGNDVMLKNYDDDVVLTICKQQLTTYGKDGKRYESQAKNAFRFYSDLRQYGFAKCKELYSESSFYKCLNNLIACGFSRAFLQNIHVEKNTKIIPLVRFCHIDFNAQLPDGYIEPISRFNSLAA